ncbi:MAG: hypothetical protein AAF915_11855 [Cyanobacteria bacterium P01_D01_bin.50]
MYPGVTGSNHDGEMVSHCVGRVPRLVASGATRRGRWGDRGMGRILNSKF